MSDVPANTAPPPAPPSAPASTPAVAPAVAPTPTAADVVTAIQALPGSEFIRLLQSMGQWDRTHMLGIRGPPRRRGPRWNAFRYHARWFAPDMGIDELRELFAKMREAHWAHERDDD